MIERYTSVLAPLASLLGVSAALVACSSDDSSSAPTTPFDSGTVVVPEAAAATPEFIQVQVQGQGTVATSNVADVDAAVEGEIVCTETSAPAQCMARTDTTLYAVAATGWVVSVWTAKGVTPGVSIDGATTSYTVSAGTPSPLIVVFVPQPGAPADAGTTTAAQVDSGS